MNRYAIILTHNRPELLHDCVTAIAPQVDAVVVIDNASDPPVQPDDLPLGGKSGLVLAVPDQPPNIAKFWNCGFDLVSGWHHDGPHWIAVLCDDAIVPAGWFDAVTGAMTTTGAAAGCSDPWGRQHPPHVKTAPDSDLMGRMPGWAYILDGTKGLRADESMHWWWCDTDLDWQARTAGGMAMIGGYAVPNVRPNDFTVHIPGLNEQAGRDGETFTAKWKQRPW